MRVGITYDLKSDYAAAGLSEEEVAEFDSEDTVQAVETSLRRHGHDPVRVGNIYRLVQRLVSKERFDLVFNFAEGLDGFGRESQIPSLLDAFRIPYVLSDPLACALTLHKGMTKRVLRDLGIPTAPFHEVTSLADLANVRLRYPIFAKPIAEGTSKGVLGDSKLEDASRLESVCGRLLERFRQPVLLEEFLPGREVTVGVVGTGVDARVLAVMEVHLLPTAEPEIYSYANKQDWRGRVDYVITTDALAQSSGELALAAWRGLGCRDLGRVDIRCAADGTPSVLEINALPGMNPTYSDLPIMARLSGTSYDQLIGWVLDSALARIRTAPPAAFPTGLIA